MYTLSAAIDECKLILSPTLRPETRLSLVLGSEQEGLSICPRTVSIEAITCWRSSPGILVAKLITCHLDSIFATTLTETQTWRRPKLKLRPKPGRNCGLAIITYIDQSMKNAEL